MAGEARPAKAAHEVATLLASAARTVTAASYGDAVRLPVAPAYVFVLDVTNAATDNADTLDVSVQTKLDGTNWTDVVHFTQVLGDGSDTLRYTAKIVPAAVAQTEFEIGTGLGAAAVRHLAGDEWRVKWVIVDADADGTFTFSVTGIPQ